jgi:hypothetical protein
LLKGEALKWYQDVDAAIQADWDNLTDLFVKTFREAGGEARALGRLSKMTMKPTESVRKYGQRVKGLIQKLTTNIAPSVQVEWYVAGFPDKMGFQIRQARPRTLAEAMEAAQNYENSAQSLRKSLRRRKSSQKGKKKHKRRSKYESSSSSTTSSSSASSSEEESSSESSEPLSPKRSSIKTGKSTAIKLREVKMEEDSKDLIKSVKETLEAIKVNLTANPKPRRSIPTVRSHIWCTRCGEAGHWASECPKPRQRRVQFVEQEGTVFWADEDEEEEEESVYQVQPAPGRGRGTPATFRPVNPTFRMSGIGPNDASPSNPRYQVFPERQYNCCFNCGGVGHYANACPFPKVGMRGGIPLSLPCQNCQQYGHEATNCPQPTQPRPTYPQVVVPPREQTALNYAHPGGVENPPK